MTKKDKIFSLIVLFFIILSLPLLYGSSFMVHSPWSKSGTTVFVERTTDNVNIGASSAPGGKVQITGDTDEIQLVIKANSTQSNSKPLILLEDSSGNDLLEIHSDNAASTFIGRDAGLNNTPGSGLKNTYVGALCGVSGTTADENVAVGYFAMNGGSPGYATAVGVEAMSSGGGSNSDAFGYQALKSLNGGNYNCAFGTGALTTVTNTHQNSAFGHTALYDCVGTQNCAFGAVAGTNISSGNYNICLGFQSGDLLTTGSSNIIIGYDIDPPANNTSNYLNLGGIFYGDMTSKIELNKQFQSHYIAEEVKTDTYVITAAEFGKSFRMNSAADKIFTLPSVATANDGARFTFIKVGAGKLTVDAADSDYIDTSGAGDGVYNDVGQTYATLTIEYCDTDVRWYIISGKGTWVPYD